jgi:hypothetical protein
MEQKFSTYEIIPYVPGLGIKLKGTYEDLKFSIGGTRYDITLPQNHIVPLLPYHEMQFYGKHQLITLQFFKAPRPRFIHFIESDGTPTTVEFDYKKGMMGYIN